MIAVLQGSLDERYMREALMLAGQGWGRTGINPLVGAIVVNKGRIAGRGFHRKIGESHAETLALIEAGTKAKGATLYVNLEPCCACGRTPPCVDMIAKAGINRVVIGMLDPNPVVNGNGAECLRRKGIEVTLDVLNRDALELNKWYKKYITSRSPYIYLKIATSKDGRICNFKRKYITSDHALRFVHSLRSRVGAVMVGINTILKDNPYLTDRLIGRNDPVRVVIDSKLRIPLDSNFIAPGVRRIIITSSNSDPEKTEKLISMGIEFINLPGEYFPLDKVFRKLAELELGSMLIEGGGLLFTQVLTEKLYDELFIFIAPEIVGEGIDFLGELSQDINVSRIKPTKIGEDLLYHVYGHN